MKEVCTASSARLESGKKQKISVKVTTVKPTSSTSNHTRKMSSYRICLFRINHHREVLMTHGWVLPIVIRKEFGSGSMAVSWIMKTGRPPTANLTVQQILTKIVPS
ncbi:hypothetical protein HOLleu_22463 [Holothuria leucospilota]|uniref:Uncharacterized protein n=1 Tax=Holothuria leucospilota TaxID=206669 RepID=A0A9Q1BZ98_HOLLE|nr:hypothetical protein HOLleu_22463 [Holothuria leucospilota]